MAFSHLGSFLVLLCLTNTVNMKGFLHDLEDFSSVGRFLLCGRLPGRTIKLLKTAQIIC